jgi:hypothetical protein
MKKFIVILFIFATILIGTGIAITNNNLSNNLSDPETNLIEHATLPGYEIIDNHNEFNDDLFVRKFLITEPEHFYQIILHRKDLNNFDEIHFLNDIDMAGYEIDYNEYGKYLLEFVIEGNGHTIFNLSLSDYLFTNAQYMTMKNLTFENIHFLNTHWRIGRVLSFFDVFSGHIENVTVNARIDGTRAQNSLDKNPHYDSYEYGLFANTSGLAKFYDVNYQICFYNVEVVPNSNNYSNFLIDQRGYNIFENINGQINIC